MEHNGRVAFLTNLIPPYHKPLFLELTRQYSDFRLFISTPMEPNRPWRPEWEGLNVVVQKGLTLNGRWRHPRGFQERLSVHLPTDTIAQLSRFQPDVVISVEMGFRTLLACLYARSNPRTKLLLWSEITEVTERGRGHLRQVLRRFLVKRAHAFLAVGAGGAQYLTSLGVNAPKIFQIAYSTDLSAFRSIPLERFGSRAYRLLYCGQFVARKGLLLFLQSLAAWAQQHPSRSLDFNLAGDGPQRPELQQFPLPSNIRLNFVGAVQYSELPCIYGEAGIFVLPTLADTWAIVINEAMASGLPVLGSVYSQAVAEMVEDGKTGWTFRADHESELSDALNRALNTSETDLNQMRFHARRRALEVTPERAATVVNQALQFAQEAG